MAVIEWSALGGRWQRKYKLVFVVLLVILSVQLFLGYHSSQLDDQARDHSGVESGRSGAFSSHLSGGSLPVDDDDSHQHHPPVMKEDFLRSILSNGAGEGGAAAPAVDSNQQGSQKVAKKRNAFADLPFKPQCEVQSKDAVSAVNRARSVECKQQILDTVCAIESGAFYAHQLTSKCPKGDFVRGRSLGCFQDEQTNRLLGGYYVNNKGTNSVGKCIEICVQSGFTYAGVQYGNECFCGSSAPPSTAKLADSSCHMKCPGGVVDGEGADDVVCGGYFTMNVFETGISKFQAQTAELIPRQGETRVKVVFLLTLNGRALRQVRRLIRALYSSSHYFYIHVDSRQDYLFRELNALERDFPNIRLTRTRFSTIWGGASLLQMLLSCMRELLEIHADWHWDFVINLSESDFPVKRLDRLVDFLTANKGRNFVKSHGRETQRFVLKQGLDKTFVECDMHMWRVGDRQLPRGIQVDGGSDWVALDRRFVRYIIEGEEEKDPLITGLLTIFRHTLLPAESFFHTTLRNSEFCSTYVDNNLHFTNWKRKLGCKCQYRHVVDWCGCSPNDFKPEDWQRLEGTEAKQLFFARKFEPIVSQAVVQRLEEWMVTEGDQIQLKQLENWGSYWQSVYHSEDVSPKGDDGLLTLCTSLVRMSMKSSHFEGVFEESERVELIKSTKILEMTYLMDEDRFKGFLVRYQVEMNSIDNIRFRYEFEFLAKGTQMVQTNKKSKFAQRMSVLEVSTEFDQKEQRARNYAKVMGPFAEPVLVFQMRRRSGKGGDSDVGMSNNITALWIDPVGNIAEISEIAMDDQPNLIYFAKSNPVHPLQAGVWTVKLLQKGTAVAQVKFLIVPLQFLNQQPISVAKAKIVNQGTENELKYQNSIEWDRHLLPREDRVELMRKMQGTGERVGVELEQWIDRLVKNFYLIHEYCVVVDSEEDYDKEESNRSSHGINKNISNNNSIVDSHGIIDSSRRLELNGNGGKQSTKRNHNWHGERFERCSKTSWSSLAPDPKSEIRGKGVVGKRGDDDDNKEDNVDL